jgi:TIR domain
MKVFISWSGAQSKAIAAVFKDWIPAVIQAVKPYFSPSDIDKGARWSTEISKELELAKVGLICLTKDNLTAPWLMFEAGALSKSLEKSRVCPMLFGVEPSDMAGPLVQFQGTQFSKEEVHKFVKTVNGQLDPTSALESSVLDSVFEKWWPELEMKVAACLAAPAKLGKRDVRSDRDLLEEILQLSRSLNLRAVEARPDADESGEVARVSPIHSQKAIESLDAFVQVSLPTMNTTEEVDAIRTAFSNLMNVLWASARGGARERLRARATSLLEQIDSRRKEIDDEIPF